MAKDVDIKVIQVAFNVLDPEQRRAYKYAYGKTNSSGYIKRLIDRDITGITPAIVPAQLDSNFEFEAESFV